MNNDQDDDEILIPVDSEVASDHFWKARAEDITKNFLRLGICLLVLGLVMIIMGIVVVASTMYEIDQVGQGIWCGVMVLVCGSLSIASRYSIPYDLVLASFIVNVIASVLLGFGIIIAAISSFQYTGTYRSEYFFLFAFGLNIWLCACLPICIYLSIIYYKIMVQSRLNGCCSDCFTRDSRVATSGYDMIYVPIREGHQDLQAWNARILM